MYKNGTILDGLGVSLLFTRINRLKIIYRPIVLEGDMES